MLLYGQYGVLEIRLCLRLQIPIGNRRKDRSRLDGPSGYRARWETNTVLLMHCSQIQ